MHKGKDKKEGGDNLQGEVCTAELLLPNSIQALCSLDSSQPFRTHVFCLLVVWFGVFFLFSMSL